MVISLKERLDEKDWSAQKARHLVNRAGFGMPRSLIEKYRQIGMARSVNHLLKVPAAQERTSAPDFLSPPADARKFLAERKDKDREEIRRMIQQRRQMARQEVGQLKYWWLEQSMTTPYPLREKMAHFWHGHFATSAQKVKESHDNYQLNEVFRQYGLGAFDRLVVKVSQSPAMLKYLDNRQNRKGHPNENFARELMELFTLGIGHYTEQDIQEAARAFTGWTLRNGTFVENRRQHDNGMKQFLGRKGKFNGYDIIRIICSQPQMSRFVTHKLWEFFVYENPDEATIAYLSSTFRSRDYAIDVVLRHIFQSKEFYSDRAVNRQIKSPAQLMLNLASQLGVDAERSNQRLLSLAMRGMGQDLFYPPNVKGWPGNRHWINSNSLLTRYNLPAYFLYGVQGLRRRDGRRQGQGADRLRQRRPGRAPFEAEAFLETYVGKPAGQTIDELCDYFIGQRLSSSQRQVLLQAIHPDASEQLPIPRSAKSAQRLVGVIHLILSTAEYQLC